MNYISISISNIIQICNLGEADLQINAINQVLNYFDWEIGDCF